MKIIACRVGQQANTEDLYNHLHYFQQFVDGYIETVTAPSGYVLVCNEEGILRNLPQNPVMDYYRSIMMNWPDSIHGNYFITFRAGDDFTDVPDNEETRELLRLLNLERGVR